MGVKGGGGRAGASKKSHERSHHGDAACPRNYRAASDAHVPSNVFLSVLFQL